MTRYTSLGRKRTRYTSLGRKRTYLEAGFSADKHTTDDPEDEAIKIIDQGLGNESPSGPPPAKKRRRVKPKKEDAKTSAKRLEEEADELADDAVASVGTKNGKDADTKKPKNENHRRSSRSEQRRFKRRQEKLANTTCFACREKGHAAKDCPKAAQSGNTTNNSTAKSNKPICYRCGSTRHTLSRCMKASNPDNPLPYASCYVCSGKGHIASSCPQNKDKGIYPNGGCCKLCGETSHLARNCPTRKQVQESGALLVGTGRDAGADEDDFHTLKRVNAQIDQEEKKENKTAKAKTKAKRRDHEMGLESNLNAIKSSITTTPAAVRKKKVVVF